MNKANTRFILQVILVVSLTICLVEIFHHCL